MTIEFDINENINVDDNEVFNEETEHASDIVSYPHFTVSITKPTGITLLFNCNVNTGIEEDTESWENEQYDLFRAESVQVYRPDEVDVDQVYASDSYHMDGELHRLLMNVLFERGIDTAFVNKLIEYSTSVEHKKYVGFLQSLGKFASEK